MVLVPGTTFPVSTGPTLLVKDKRFSLDHEANSGTYTLSIKNVKRSDGATYQCQVVVELHNVITGDVKLLMKTPPVMKDDAATRTVQVDEFAHGKGIIEGKASRHIGCTWENC